MDGGGTFGQILFKGGGRRDKGLEQPWLGTGRLLLTVEGGGRREVSAETGVAMRRGESRE